ncbi:MAG: hypothetical protein KGR17_11610 [Acidobacteria bacterium]|nr:hypothetical protein [Acidobacteriota bacterium]
MSILAVVPLATVLCAASASNAAEPQAAFALKDGWVALAVTRDGVPVNEARIKVCDGQGQPFATGETGQEGRGEFPLPPGPSFTVEIKVGDRTADPIRLTHGSAGLFPSEVLLTFGLSPCCRVPSRGWAVGAERVPAREPRPDTMPELLLAVGVAGTAIIVSLIVVFLFPRRNESHPPK